MCIKFHRLDSRLRGNNSVYARQASFSFEIRQNFLGYMTVSHPSQFLAKSFARWSKGLISIVLYSTAVIPAVCGGYLSE